MVETAIVSSSLESQLPTAILQRIAGTGCPDVLTCQARLTRQGLILEIQRFPFDFSCWENLQFADEKLASLKGHRPGFPQHQLDFRKRTFMRNPLEKMVIRTAQHEELEDATDKMSVIASPVGGSFGLVRSSGTKPHQGWDLYSSVNAPVYTIADCLVVSICDSFGPEQCQDGSYGNSVCILLTDPALQELSQIKQCDFFAFYGHLADVQVKVGDQPREGIVLGHVGRSGNACHSPSHLHFEIRTMASPPSMSGLKYRMDPGELLGYDKYSSRAE